MTRTQIETQSSLFGKKKKKGGGGGGGGGGYNKKGGGQPQQEKQSVKDARFDAATYVRFCTFMDSHYTGISRPTTHTSHKSYYSISSSRQFMFTMMGLSKTLPDKSKTILKNINLSFYPGAKIVSAF